MFAMALPSLPPRTCPAAFLFSASRWSMALSGSKAARASWIWLASCIPTCHPPSGSRIWAALLGLEDVLGQLGQQARLHLGSAALLGRVCRARRAELDQHRRGPQVGGIHDLLHGLR